MKKIIYLSAILGSIFYGGATIAAVDVNSANNPVCGKYVIKDNMITVKCDFPESIEHISTVLEGSSKCFGEICREVDLDDIRLNKLLILKNSKKSQEINLESVEIGIRLDSFAEAVKLMDINFDGYDDIQLWASPTASANTIYEYWLYNPKTGLFDATDLGKKLFGYYIVPDSKTNTILVKSHSGCCYNWEKTYHWVGNELRKKMVRYYGALAAEGCGQTITHYNDNEEVLSMEVEPSGYCKGDEHNEPMSLKPYISMLKNGEKDGNYALKKKAGGKYTVIYNKPSKQNIINP